MNVTCPGCAAPLTIPDERLPKGKVATAVCPRCKGPISIDMTAVSPQPAPPKPPAAPPPAEEPEGYQAREQPHALVCVNVPAERQQIITILKQLGYVPHSCKDSGEATGRLRLAAYAIVVLSAAFDPPGQDGPSIRACLADMGMTGRRNIHVVLIDPGMASNDQRAAFAHSVDLVLNPNDLPRFEEALGRSRTETETRYRVLKESLRAMGKA
jgi:CheY-like chemotaxis protein